MDAKFFRACQETDNLYKKAIEAVTLAESETSKAKAEASRLSKIRHTYNQAQGLIVFLLEKSGTYNLPLSLSLKPEFTTPEIYQLAREVMERLGFSLCLIEDRYTLSLKQEQVIY